MNKLNIIKLIYFFLFFNSKYIKKRKIQYNTKKKKKYIYINKINYIK